MENISFYLYLFNYVLFIILAWPFIPVYIGSIKNRNGKESGRVFLYAFILLVLCVFGYSDWDFSSYYLIYEECKRGVEGGLEPIYIWLISYTDNYFIWRLIIWGLATYLMIVTIRRLPVRLNCVLLFITLFYILSFYKLRNVLGFSLLYLGATIILYHNKKKHKATIFGWCLIFASFFCHRSMLLTILVCFVGALISLNKTKASILLLMWPIFTIAMTIVLKIIVSGGVDNELEQIDAVGKATRYAGGEKGEVNINGLIKLLLDNTAYLSCFYLLTKELIYNKLSCPKIISFYYNIWFIFTYIGYALFFQEASKWLSIRVLTMGYFPMAVVLGWYYSYQKRTCYQRIILCISGLYYLFSVSYILYKGL